MSNEEVIKRLSAYITCLKCEISGKECDDNCRYQYEAGTMGEIVEALETLIRAEPQEHKGKWTLSESSYYIDTVAQCSECGFEILVNQLCNGLHDVEDLVYCPSCGARMEVEHE